MVFVEHSVTFKGDLESAWDKLIDYKKMPEWDIFVDDVQLDGPMKIGSAGRLKSRDGHIYALSITSYTPLSDYSDEMTIMGSKFVFYHELKEKSPGEITMRFTITASGLIAFVFQYPIKNALVQKLPILMENFKLQYEQSKQHTLT